MLPVFNECMVSPKDQSAQLQVCPGWRNNFQSEPHNCWTENLARGAATPDTNTKLNPRSAQGQPNLLQKQQLPHIPVEQRAHTWFTIAQVEEKGEDKWTQLKSWETEGEYRPCSPLNPQHEQDFHPSLSTSMPEYLACYFSPHTAHNYRSYLYVRRNPPDFIFPLLAESTE